jgi:hypothetical protein
MRRAARPNPPARRPAIAMLVLRALFPRLAMSALLFFPPSPPPSGS